MWMVLVPPPSMSHYWLQIFCITLLALCFGPQQSPHLGDHVLWDSGLPVSFVCTSEVFCVCLWLFVSFLPFSSKRHCHQPSHEHLRNPAIPAGAPEKHRG